MDCSVLRAKKSGRKPEAAPPPPTPPLARYEGENGHHHHHHHCRTGRYRDNGYMDPLDYLSSTRRLNSIDIAHVRNVRMNFRDFSDADADFYASRGPPPYGYPEYAIGHGGHGAHACLPPPMYMMPPPPLPPPPPQQQFGYDSRPARYPPFHLYDGENPNNCGVM